MGGLFDGFEMLNSRRSPAVWHGWIYVGTRAGAIYGISNPK